MPIYGYQCSSCQHQKDVLQKISDPVLTVCPACGEATFSKQVSAPAFQLKGTGWYVTDFRDGNKGKNDKAGDGGNSDNPPGEASSPAKGGSDESSGKSQSAAPSSTDSTAPKGDSPSQANSPAPAPSTKPSSPSAGTSSGP